MIGSWKRVVGGRWAALLACAICAASCKGGTDQNAEPAAATASGTVALPPGVSLPMAGLTLGGGLGSTVLPASGAFSVSELAGGGPATVLLSTPAGKLVLLGHVDSDDASFSEVSATSTAVELLFLSTGSTALPYAEWKQVYRLLHAAPETATLASVIAARMAVSPTAVGDQDPAITSALTAATASLVGTAAIGPSLGQGHGEKIVVGRRSPEATASSVLSISVSSADPYGLTVAPTIDGKGVKLTNTVRIHRHYYVYRTAYVPAAGALNDEPTKLSTWKLVQDGFLPATTGVTGVISSLADYFGGKTAWAAQTKDVALALEPADAKVNVYQVFVVGAGASLVTPGAELLGQSDAFAAVHEGRNDAIVLEAVKEIFWPILTKLFPANWNATLWSDPAKYGPALKIFNQFLKEAAAAGVNYAVQLEKGDLRPTMVDIFKALSSNKQIKEACFNLMVNLLDPAVGLSFAKVKPDATWVGSALAQLAASINLVDKILVATDVVSIGTEIAKSQDHNQWDVKAITPTVVLTPAAVTLTPDSSKQDFTAAVQGYASNGGTSSYLYQFDCGLKGTMDDHHGKTGNLFTTDQKTVTYSVPGTFPTTGSDKITVEVFDGSRASLGTTSAAITFAPNSYSLAVSPAQGGAVANASVAISAPLNKLPTDPKAVVTWTWALAGSAGGKLQSGASSGLQLDTASDSVTYVANAAAANPQVDTITVTAYLGSTDDPTKHVALATGQSVITIKPKYRVNSYIVWAYTKFVLNGVTIVDTSKGDLISNFTAGFNLAGAKGDQLQVVVTSWQYAGWYSVNGKTSFAMGPISMTTPDGATVTLENVPPTQGAPPLNTVLFDQTIALP